MGIVINLRDVMHKKGIRYLADIKRSSGVNYNTLSKLYDGTAKAVHLDVLGRVCKSVDCEPGELFESVEDVDDE